MVSKRSVLIRYFGMSQEPYAAGYIYGCVLSIGVLVRLRVRRRLDRRLVAS